MKKLSRAVIALILMTVMLLSATSCAYVGMDALFGDTESGGDSGDYLTREEVEKMLEGLEKNITVQGGNTTVIESITSNYDRNLLAASKGLLSVVSIASTFKVTYTYQGGFGLPTTTTSETTSYGSGVIYQLDKEQGDAYIITNHHVVYNSSSDTSDKISDDINIYLYGQEYLDYAIPAKYVGGSVNYDIAVLKVTGSETLIRSNAIPATFANSDDVSVLDTAIAIGNPEAEGISATVGTVNVDSEEIELSNPTGGSAIKLRVMRTDAAVNSGNSGGGLFNDRGEIIGIANAKMADTSVDNIGYAIPSNVAKNVADNIIYYDSLDASCDSVQRVMLGIKVTVGEAYTKYDTETGKVHKLEQVIISEVEDGGAADGVLRVDDIINSVTIDGVEYKVTRTFNVVDVMLTARKSGSKVSTVVFNVTRGNTTLSLTVDISSVTLSSY